MPEDAGGGRGGIPGGEIPALYRPLLPQRVQRCAPVEDENSCLLESYCIYATIQKELPLLQ